MADSATDSLETTLRAAMRGPIEATRLDFSEFMRSARIGIEQAFSSSTAAVDEKTRNRAVWTLYSDGVPSDFRGLRAATFALADSIEVDNDESWSPISDPFCFNEVLNAVTNTPWSEFERARLAAGLVYAYLQIDGPDAARQGDEQLAARWRALPPVIHKLTKNPARETAIHREIGAFPQLLEPSDPTNGWPSDPADAPMHISETSWFWRELLVTRARELASAPRSTFEASWENLLERARPHASVYDLILGAIADAYVEHGLPEHEALRDQAVERWGNPFSKSAVQEWLTFVEPETHARIRGWLAESMVTVFFDVLAQDWRTDARRPNFWKLYAPFMSEVTFFLGRRAQATASTKIRSLRRSSPDAFRTLDHPNLNAFAMRIGGSVYVEFSEYGNAAYAHTAQSWKTVPDGRQKAVTPPKLRSGGLQWKHVPSDTWPAKFESKIQQRDQVRPRRRR